MKTEAQLRRDIRVRVLLLRQRDVEPDRFRADIAGAAVGRLHDARTAAGHHHDAAADREIAAMPDQPPELARDIVISALGRMRLAIPSRWRSTSSSGLRQAHGRLHRRRGVPLPAQGCGCRRTRRSCARRSARSAAFAACDSRASAAARACPRAAGTRDRGRLGDSSGCRGSCGPGQGPAGLPSRVSADAAAMAPGGMWSARGVSSGCIYRRRWRCGTHRRHAISAPRGYSAATASRLRRFGIAGAGAAMLPFASTASSVVRISASFCGCSTLWPNRFLT